MAGNRHGLRTLWFQVHKWIGILLAILVVPLSLSGATLVWHDSLDTMINPQRQIVGDGSASLPPSAYAAAARPRLAPGDRIASLRFEQSEAALLTAARAPASGAARGGPPARTNVWLDPADARVLDAAGSNSGLVRMLHGFHGSLLFPGVGRQIVGWLGVAMLSSSLTGLWLWWPTAGAWTRGLRWRRGNDGWTNLHHLAGFWVCVPLALLSFTGAWIAFPAFFGALSGQAAPNAAERMARMRAQPLAAPATGVDRAVATALAQRPGRLVAVTWPTDRAAQWRITVASGDRTADVTIDDASGAIERPARGGDRGGQGGLARTMRRLHDGSDMGIAWQAIIFLGGLLPAILGVTGIVMWWRSRGWRADVSRRQRDRQAAAAAE